MIKNIVFDFGGILLDLEQQATYDAFSDLLGEKVSKENANQRLGNALIDIEKGNISTEAFIEKFQELKDANIDSKTILEAWNAMLLKIRPEIFPFLKEAKNRYRTILLSNTNSIHIEYALNSMIKGNHGIHDWENYFHSIYYSHELHMRKPDHEIYSKVIQLENINPQETLFIDDTLENVEAAIACGWHSIQHIPSENIEDKLQEYIDNCGTK